MMNYDTKEATKLRGKLNYIPWLQKFEIVATTKKWLKPDDTWDETFKTDILEWLVENIHLDAIGPIDRKATIHENMIQLNNEFGHGLANPDIFEESILENVKFPIDRDPQTVFTWINQQLNVLKSCGGSVTAKLKLKILLKGLLSDKEWYECRGKLSMDYADRPFSEQTAFIYKWWDHHRNPDRLYHVDAFDPRALRPRRVMQTNWSCNYCSKYAERKRLSRGHPTERCWYGDVPGSANELAHLRPKISSNKEQSKYFVGAVKKSFKAVYDTGASPVSFFKDKPDNFKLRQGKVHTAGADELSIVGSGTAQFGNVILPQVEQAPELNYNLVSGVQLMRMGYDTLLKSNGKLLIMKDGLVQCTGYYSESDNLIMLDNEIDNSTKYDKPKCLSVTQRIESNWHEVWGHAGKSLLDATTKYYNLQVKDISKAGVCEPCIQGKGRQRNIPKRSEMKYDTLDVIEIDAQGPFPIESSEGDKFNIKFIDKASGFIFYRSLPDIKAITILGEFQIFQDRLERYTGKTIKTVRSDGGTELKGAMLDFLKSKGILKQTSHAYEHHLPAQAERAHQTVLHFSRAMLIASNLPLKYWHDAQATATYLLNRMVHSNQDKCPYEILFGKKPNINHLRIFGMVCYAFIPQEVRNKLEPIRHKCRLLGYTDDFSAEEMTGYKLLRESDRVVIYSNDVIFDFDTQMQSLPETVAPNPHSMFRHANENAGSDYAESSSMTNSCSETPEASVSSSSELASTTSTSIDPTSTTESTGTETMDTALEYPSDVDDVHDLPIETAIHQGHIDTSRRHLENQEEIMSVQNILNLVKGIPLNNDCMSGIICALFQSSLDIPQTFEQAMASKDRDKWWEAMQKEFNSLEEFHTFILETLPTNRKQIKGRWVFSKKYNAKGEVIRYKARWVAKGFTQVAGIDFHETFAPVVNFKSVRIIVALVAQRDWHIFQDDVPTAFLRAPIDETIYMEQPTGFEKGTLACRLLKSLYGLKQSPRLWNRYFHDFLVKFGFKQCKSDPCVYVKNDMIIALFVDDIITAGQHIDEVNAFRSAMQDYFSMDPTNGGKLEWYLGIQFVRSSNGISLNQTQYLKEKLELYNSFIGRGGISTPLPIDYQRQLETATDEDADPKFPYRSMVGSLMYAMVGTRPDLAVAVSVVSRYLERPKKIHCKLVSHIWQYIRSNLDIGLNYKKGNDPIILSGYVDASYANEEKCKSTTGYGFLLSGSVVSWICQRQSSVAQSTAESEYYAAVAAANETIWLKSLLGELNVPQSTITLYEDNKACIALSKNPQDHKRTKHIQIKYHVLREYVANKEVELVYCGTESQLADMFTKPLPGHKIRAHLNALGIASTCHPDSEFGGVSSSESQNT